MESLLQLEMIPTPLSVPSAHQQLNATQKPSSALPRHSASLHAVRKPAMKPGRRHEPTPLFRVYLADPGEFRHLVQRLTGAPQLSQAAKETLPSSITTALPPALALDATQVASSPPYHHSVQLQDDHMISTTPALQLNFATDLSFDHDVVTSGNRGFVPQVNTYERVQSSQTAMVGNTESTELTALDHESIIWSSLPTILSPVAIADQWAIFDDNTTKAL